MTVEDFKVIGLTVMFGMVYVVVFGVPAALVYLAFRHKDYGKRGN